MWSRFLIALFLVIHIGSAATFLTPALFSTLLKSKLSEMGVTEPPKESISPEMVELQSLMSDYCESPAEYEAFMADITGHGIVVIPFFFNMFLNHAQQRIVSTEIRKEFGYEALGPVTNHTSPSEEEIKEASTIKEYYELMERRNLTLQYPAFLSSDEDAEIVVTLMDKHFPHIRTTFINKLDEIRHRSGAPITVNRDEVDLIIDEGAIYCEKAKKELLRKWAKETIACPIFGILLPTFFNVGETKLDVNVLAKKMGTTDF